MKKQRVCNISPKEQKRRILLGVITMLIAFSLGVYCAGHEPTPKLRLLLFLFFFVGTLCFFQVRGKTCVFLAYSHRSKMGDEVVKVEGAARDKLQGQAHKIILKALVTAAVLTILFISN